MRVLIAEDDPALASFVRKGLEAEHYAVDVTTDGEQARAMAGELDYDLLMLDLNLPRVDGVTILRHLRTRKPSLPILVLTSRNRVEDRVQCLDLGADDYMGKPFSFAELSPRIRALLRDRKSTRLNSSHSQISYAVFCLKKKKIQCVSARRPCRDLRLGLRDRRLSAVVVAQAVLRRRRCRVSSRCAPQG